MATNLTTLTSVRGLASVLRDRDHQWITNLGRDPKLDVGSPEKLPESTSVVTSSQSRVTSALKTEFLTSAYTASSFSETIRNDSLVTNSIGIPRDGRGQGGRKLPAERKAPRISSAEDVERFLSEIAAVDEDIREEFETLDALFVELQELIDNFDADNLKDSLLDSTRHKIDQLIVNLERILPTVGVQDQLIVELQHQIASYSRNSGGDTSSESLEDGSVIDSIISELNTFDSDDYGPQTRLSEDSLTARDKLGIRVELLHRLILELRDFPFMKSTATSGTDNIYAFSVNLPISVDLPGTPITDLQNTSQVSSIVIDPNGLNLTAYATGKNTINVNLGSRKLTDRFETRVRLNGGIDLDAKSHGLSPTKSLAGEFSGRDPAITTNPVTSTSLNLGQIIDDQAIRDFSDSLNARLDILRQQVEKLNAITLPEEPEPTRLTTEIRRSDSIFVSDLQHENVVLGIRIRQNPNASTEDFLEPRARFSPLQLGSVRLGSASSGRMIIEKRPFSESEFDRFAKDNTGLLTNRYR